MRILLVEDDADLAELIALGLRNASYAVDMVGTCADAEELLRTTVFDVACFDLGLPDGDGFDLVRRLSEDPELRRPRRLLVLTARDAVADRVAGLDAGADDYLVKPFAFAELLARVRTLLRRRPISQGDILQIGDLAIDFHGHRAVRSGKRLDLTPKEFSLLSFLAQRKGEVVTRTVIAGQVWDMNFDSHTNVVDVHIRRLRAKVDDPFEPKLIRTVRGVGYVLDESH